MKIQLALLITKAELIQTLSWRSLYKNTFTTNTILQMENNTMKDTGITRRVDELGRIVIPRELRKTLRIKEGDALEFYSDGDKLIIRKYSPIETIENSAKAVADGLTELTEKPCVIVDGNKVVYASPNKLKDLVGREISYKLLTAIVDRKSLILSRADGGEIVPIVDDNSLIIENELIVPIISQGDAFGAVVLFDEDKESSFNYADAKLVRLGASLIVKQFE